MSNIYLVSVVALLLVCNKHLVFVSADCNRKSEIKASPVYVDENFNDASSIGGNHLIDKITSITVFTGPYWGNKVVSKLVTTYKLKDGTSRTLTRGNGGSEAGSVVLPDGVYLKSINIKRGAYVDWIRFTDTDGNMSEKFGGNTNLGASQTGGVIEWNNGVIKSLRGKHGAVIDAVHASVELNQIYSAKMKDPVYKFESATIEDSTSTPDAKLTLDNLDGPIEQSITREWSKTVTTNEVTTVTKGSEFGVDTNFGYTASAGFNYVFASGGIETTFNVGTSLSNSYKESSSNEQELSKKLTTTVPITAPAGTLATADVHFTIVHYKFSWEAPTVCTYTYAPKTQVSGDSFEGSMSGSQPFEEVKVVYSFEYAPAAPTVSPTPVQTISIPTTPPTRKPTVDCSLFSSRKSCRRAGCSWGRRPKACSA